MLALWIAIIAACQAGTAQIAPPTTATPAAAGNAAGRSLAQAAATAQTPQVYASAAPAAAPAAPAPAAPPPPAQQAGDVDTTATDAQQQQQQLGDAAPARAPPPRARLYNMSLEFSASDSDSQIMAAESLYANVLAVQFTFTACTGVNAHHHSAIETIQVPVGKVTVGVVSLSNEFSFFNVTTSQMLVIPAGSVHFYLNPGCNTSKMQATWPANTRTAFELPALNALSAEAFAILATAGPAPAARPGFPLITDPACAARCGVAPPAPLPQPQPLG